MSLIHRDVFDLIPRHFHDLTRDLSQFQPFAWPAMNVKEDSKGILVTVDVPGSEDVTVDLNSDVLTISGKRTEEVFEDKENYHRRERHFGSFSRTVKVYPGTRPEDITAENDRGVLHVRVNRPPDTTPPSGNIPITHRHS